MKSKFVCLLFMLSLAGVSRGQNSYVRGEMIDSRDGKSYETVTINKTMWLAENMKFKTEHADIISEADIAIDIDGYYYPYDESDEACPIGFAIPKESDWKRYVHFLLELKNISKASTEESSHSSKKVTGTSMNVLDDNFNFFEESNPLNLKISGMTQGGEFVMDGALNFWSRKDGSDDSKYHLHIEHNVYGNHTHAHHVVTKKKKKRRQFVVRCVKADT